MTPTESHPMVTEEMVEAAAKHMYFQMCGVLSDHNMAWKMTGTKEAFRKCAKAALTAVLPLIGEACAKIAEVRHSHWRMPHPDDAAPFEVCDDVSACRDIAIAIRTATVQEVNRG